VVAIPGGRATDLPAACRADVDDTRDRINNARNQPRRCNRTIPLRPFRSGWIRQEIGRNRARRRGDSAGPDARGAVFHRARRPHAETAGM